MNIKNAIKKYKENIDLMIKNYDEIGPNEKDILLRNTTTI